MNEYPINFLTEFWFDPSYCLLSLNIFQIIIYTTAHATDCNYLYQNHNTRVENKFVLQVCRL